MTGSVISPTDLVSVAGLVVPRPPVSALGPEDPSSLVGDSIRLPIGTAGSPVTLLVNLSSLAPGLEPEEHLLLRLLTSTELSGLIANGHRGLVPIVAVSLR